MLVCAPTGAGKTVVGEFAVHLALTGGRKCFYTTPIKALSNQKFADLTARYGADKIGLLTGDTSINGGAPVVVMTTEVLRNMLYSGSSTLDGLAYVVMDEVHYLADRFRGPVWEEVILHLPEHVQVVGLSATVSNAEEFGEWLVEVRGDTAVVVDEHRPVPLWQHMLVGNQMLDLFEGDQTHARINTAGAAQDRGAHALPRAVQPRAQPRRWWRPRPPGAQQRVQADLAHRHDPAARRGGVCCPRSCSCSAVRVVTRRSRRRPVRGCGSTRRRRPSRFAGSSTRRRATCRRPTWPCSGTGSGVRPWSGASRRTTPGCCPRSRRRSRSCSSAGWSRSCSRPRRSRWASTCPRGRSCSRSS